MTKKRKRQYRIRNWTDYNKALVRPGSLTLWIDTRSTDTWLDRSRPCRRGRRPTYTDAAIICALLLREAYHLPLRSTQGLVASVLRLMQLKLPSPHYSTLSRRARRLRLCLAAPEKIRHLVIDSTGLKLYGEGEWKVRLHGADKRRTWRKLHLAMDAERWQITSILVTDKEELDRHILPPLLKQTKAEVVPCVPMGLMTFKSATELLRIVCQCP